MNTVYSRQSPPPGAVLRSSCDVCAASKVKCTQERPVCRRCASSGAACVYGVSRKHGRKRPPSQKDAGKSMRRIAPTNIITTSPSHQYHRRTSSVEQSLLPNSVSISTQFNPLDEFGDFNAFQDALASWDLMPTNLYEFPSPVMSSPMATTPGLSPSMSSSSARMSSGPQGEGLSGDPDDHGNCQKPNACYTLASSTLDSLHASQPASLNLDYVLRRNKTALRIVIGLLKCPCSRDPHLAMLYSSILCKILCWYQHATSVKNSLPTPTSPRCTIQSSTLEKSPQPYASHSSNTGPTSNPERRPPFIVAPLHITAGEFDLDDEDQEALGRLLLLSELRKAGLIIDELSNKYRQVGDHSDEKTGDIYAMLGTWLKAELARTIRDVQT